MKNDCHCEKCNIVIEKSTHQKDQEVYIFSSEKYAVPRNFKLKMNAMREVQHCDAAKYKLVRPKYIYLI
jgi:hypothetical protein